MNKINPVTTKKISPKLALIILIVGTLFIIWCAISLVGSKSLPSSGDTVSLVHGNTDILCGTTQQNYSDLINALIKKDDYGFNEMMASGKSFTVSSGTKALILEMDGGSAEVRILEGTHINEIAWVAIEATEK